MAAILTNGEIPAQGAPVPGMLSFTHFPSGLGPPVLSY
jgi:hypothetical protein